MSVRTELLSVADELRALRGPVEPDGFDVQTIKLTIVQRVWSGVKEGLGTKTDTVLLDVLQQYPIRHVSAREIASSGGRYEAEDLKMGPVTPAFTSDGGGGYSPSDLKPNGITGTEIVYVLTGAVAGDYQLVELHTERAFRYMLVLRRKRNTP